MSAADVTEKRLQILRRHSYSSDDPRAVERLAEDHGTPISVALSQLDSMAKSSRQSPAQDRPWLNKEARQALSRDLADG